MAFKKFLALLSVVALLAGVLCACGDDSQDTTPSDTSPAASSYTVTLLDQNGNPVSGVVVTFLAADGSTAMKVSDASGKAVYDAGEATGAELTSIPDGYTATAKSVSFSEGAELTVTLTALQMQDDSVTYTVTVVDQNGNPVPGVTLQLCDEENCKLPVDTDENGVISVTYEESDYHVTIAELPEGYACEVLEYYFDGATELTITVTAE